MNANTTIQINTTAGDALTIPATQSHLTAYRWTEIRSPRGHGDYRTRAYRLSLGDERMTVVTCELVHNLFHADVLDVAYPQDSTDLRDELRYGDEWARDMSSSDQPQTPPWSACPQCGARDLSEAQRNSVCDACQSAAAQTSSVPADVAPISQIDAVPLPTNNQALMVATVPAGLVMPGQIVLSAGTSTRSRRLSMTAGTLAHWSDDGAGVVVGSILSDDQVYVCLTVRMFDGSDRSDDSGSVWERSFPVDALMVTARGL